MIVVLDKLFVRSVAAELCGFAGCVSREYARCARSEMCLDGGPAYEVDQRRGELGSAELSGTSQGPTCACTCCGRQRYVVSLMSITRLGMPAPIALSQQRTHVRRNVRRAVLSKQRSDIIML